jgi:hypothetical protein
MLLTQVKSKHAIDEIQEFTLAIYGVISGTAK